MKNRRILSHPELEPNQIRAIDPFSKFDSDIVNRLTKIVHKVDQPDIIVDGLDVLENCSDNIEYLSQELVDYNKFEFVNNCSLISDNELQVYVPDNNPKEIKDGYITQDLGDNNCLNLKKFYGSDVTKSFVLTFGLNGGTPQNLYIKIGNDVLDLRYLDGNYEETDNVDKVSTYSVILNVNFKNITDKLTLKFGAYIDVSDVRNFYSHDEINEVSFMTISNISCKMLIRDQSNEFPFYVTNDWDINNTHLVKNLKVTEGAAIKDNVVINSLQSVNIGNSVVVLPLSDKKSWIHNNEYTTADFYIDNPSIFDIKVDILDNSNLSYLSSTIDEMGDLKVIIQNEATGQKKVVSLNNENSLGNTYLTFEKISEDNETATFQTNKISIKDKFCGSTILIFNKDKILTKVDVDITSEWLPQVTFKLNKKDFTSVKDITVRLSNATLKVSKNSKHCLWGYVVCYYSYFKNPNPNPCYIGLIRESDYKKEGYTEDYLVLAKVRFVDPNTIDLIQYLDNRNNYAKLTGRDINYIVNFNIPDIWYSHNPVNVTDAINYCRILRNDVRTRFKFKHDNDAEIDVSYSLLNTDGKIDKKGKISVDLKDDNVDTLYQLQRRIAPTLRQIQITNIYDSDIDIDLQTQKIFNWDILRSKWITADEKWAVNEDGSAFGIYSKPSNTIEEKYFGFNRQGCFEFINPRTGKTAITFDWIYSSLADVTIPQRREDASYDQFDIARDNTYLLSYYPKDHKEDDAKFISDEICNSKHNHFSYLVFREQFLTKKYLTKMLDMLPKTPEYLIDGRILAVADGHIQSTLHKVSNDLIDRNLINAETYDEDGDIIKSTSYWISTNNFKTKGNADSKLTPKKLQDNQVIICDTVDGKKEIQSSNYIIDELNNSHLITSEIDEDGIIHIKSTKTRIGGDLIDGNTVIGKVYDDHQTLDTDRYYFSTSNKRTIDSSDKLLQDEHLLIANKESNTKTAIESSNYIIDGDLRNNYVLKSVSDDNNVIHIRSSKNKISNTLYNNNVVIAKDVSDTSATIETVKYEISTTNHGTIDLQDKPLQDNQLITVNTANDEKYIESANVMIDNEKPANDKGFHYVKISKTDSNGVIHVCNSNKTLNELIYSLWYLPNNIRIKDDNKVHIDIDCKKKFKISASTILKAIQGDSRYKTIFNYDIDNENPVLFNLVIHIDTQNSDSDPDRSISEDGIFKCSARKYESELLLINDIGLSEIRRHVVTEKERTHVVTEEDNKHLVLENDEYSKFRTCINVEYVINNGIIETTNTIEWIDELRGYDNGIGEEKPYHEIGNAENVDYIFSLTDVNPEVEDSSTEVIELDDANATIDSTDDVDFDIDDVTIKSTLTADDVENIDWVEDVDDIKIITSTTSVDIIGDGEEISDGRPTDATNVYEDISSLLTLYPMLFINQKFARLLRSDHGYGDVRGPLESVFAQTKTHLTFNYVKNNNEVIENLVPGITFGDPEDTIMYAYSETYNI